jgi:predicted nucleic acid-binding Zn ribbon protein
MLLVIEDDNIIMEEKSRMMKKVKYKVGMMKKGYGMKNVDKKKGGKKKKDKEKRKKDIGEIIKKIMNIKDK